MSNRPRNPTHYPGIAPLTYDRLINATTGPDGSLWAATRLDRGAESRIGLFRSVDPCEAMQPVANLTVTGHPQRPSLIVCENGNVHLVWNARDEYGWVVEHAFRTDRETVTETVSRSDTLILPPCLAQFAGSLWAAWPQRRGHTTHIVLGRREPNGSWNVTILAESGAPAFRPVAASNGKTLLVAWDRYREGAYEIVCREVDAGGSPGPERAFSGDGRHWLAPAACAWGRAYCLAWQQVSEVEDPALGAVDHDVSILCCTVEQEDVRWMPAGENNAPCPAADLRPGLLPADGEPYRGYDGLRRRPQWTAARNGELWLLWEARDASGSKRAGRLMARRLDEISEPFVLHDGGVCYAAPPFCHGDGLPVAYVPAESEPEPVLRCAKLDPVSPPSESDASRALRLDVNKWRRWRDARPTESLPGRRTIESPDGPFNLYWLDLHCHSVYSPDAEGGPDELIHYARDFARLDGVAVVDNDYYPNKTLAEAEWLAEQEMAEMFTEPGRFLVFPAYEFTYHNPELTPDFNHRYVLYPGPGGRLLRRVDAESDTFDKLEEQLRDEDVLLVAHHCTWRLGTSVPENVEVCSSWRVCIEETNFIGKRLAAGDRFGFMASSDSHRACPGMGGALTGVFAKELTPRAVFDALCRRRTIATQGERVLLDLRVNGALIGDEITSSGNISIHLQFEAPRDVEFVEMIRDGDVIHRVDRPGRVSEIEYADRTLIPGAHAYFARLKCVGDPSFNAPHQPRDYYKAFATDGPYASNLANARGPFAWSTPIWVQTGG